MADFSIYFATIFESLFRRVELAEDYFEQSAWVLGDLFSAKDIQLRSEAIRKSYPLETSTLRVISKCDLNRRLLILLVFQYEVAFVLNHDLVVFVLGNPAIDRATAYVGHVIRIIACA